MRFGRRLACGLALQATACGISKCPPTNPEALERTPALLSQTGLYQIAAGAAGLGAKGALSTVALDVVPYTPKFELWADGAAKRRWLHLPAGSRIDTSDMNDWRFPEGTKIWKEFARNGKVVETRLLSKYGPTDDEWVTVAYIWNEQGTDAVLSVEGEDNVGGTPHDVPSSSACMGCHGGTNGRVLGVSAVQLPRASADSNAVTLMSLVNTRRLSHPLPAKLDPPGSELAQQALGYLHANCGSCHTQGRIKRSDFRCYDPERDLDLTLRVESMAEVKDTGTYRTALGKSLIPGDPDDSSLVSRSERRFYRHMPPLATELVDVTGMKTVRDWIQSLPPEPSP